MGTSKSYSNTVAVSFGGSKQQNENKQNQVSGPPSRLPSNYLTSGYYNDKDEYDISYITDKAESIGSMLTRGDGRTSTSKVRAYFDVVELTHRQLMTKGVNINQVRTTLATLKARVNNAEAKKNASRLFKDFIIKNVDIVIKSNDDKVAQNLTGFKQHFEAVVCYMH